MSFSQLSSVPDVSLPTRQETRSNHGSEQSSDEDMSDADSAHQPNADVTTEEINFFVENRQLEALTKIWKAARPIQSIGEL